MPLTVVGVAGRAGAAPVAVVSPLVELGSALHVLRDPGHHGAAGWATTVRARMSPRLAESDLGRLGELAQRLWTVPGQASYRHASIHLDGAS